MQTSGLPLDPEPQHLSMLFLTLQQAKGHTNRRRDRSRAVPPPKSGRGPNSKKSRSPPPKQILQSSHSLAYAITQPWKLTAPYSQAPLAFCDGLHSVCTVCFSLNPLLAHRFVSPGIPAATRPQEPSFITCWHQVCDPSWRTLGSGWVQALAKWLQVLVWGAWFHMALLNKLILLVHGPT